MQLFILIRGHQGSGKSTFAQQKIQEFTDTYPNGEVIHIENDLLLTDENGNYHWSPERLDKAAKRGQAMMKAALIKGKANPSADMLIINSNTNQNAKACLAMLQLAKKHGFDSQVYRLHNFYDNVHNVRQNDVISAYLRLNDNPLRAEIHVSAQQPMSDDLKSQLESWQSFNQKTLSFDEKQQTYVTKDYLRYGKQNFIIKNAKLYPELFVLKYARQVFFANRFDDALLEMRGLIIDKYHNIIVRPFKKTFNYSERIAKNSKYPLRLSDNHLLDVVVKVNGFLGVCTYVDLPDNHPSFHASFNKKVLYSTTGSLDSDFAKMNQSHCQKYESLFKAYPNHTFLFEVTDPTDVHIIQESFGETLIGIIEVATGKQFCENKLDEIADKFNKENKQTGVQLTRPQRICNIRFGDLKELLKTVKHEGFMVFDSQSQELLFKLKSPYYLISKFLGRGNEKSLQRKLDKRHVDEEYYPLIDHIKANQDTFNQLSELDKIAFIQEFLSQI